MAEEQRNDVPAPNPPAGGQVSGQAGGRSLTRRALVMMGLRIALVIVIVTVLSYLHVYNTLRAAAREDLRQRVELAARAESAPFQHAERQATQVRDEYLRRLAAHGDRDPAAEFAGRFIIAADGAVRSRPQPADGRRHAVAWLPPVEDPPDADLRRRLLTGWDLLEQWGPLLADGRLGGFIALRDPALIGFRPPADGPTHHDDCMREAVASAAPLVDPERSPRWSDACFDHLSGEWLVSCVVPGDVAGRWTVTAGQEVPITGLVRRVTAGESMADGQGGHGPWAFVVDRRRRLVAHPQHTARIAEADGNLPVEQAGDLALTAQVAAALTAAAGAGGGAGVVVEPPAGAATIGVAAIAGPDWLLVAVHPTAQQADQAFASASMVLLLGAAGLAIELAIMAFIMRRQIAAPIAGIVAATERISGGDFAVALDHRRDDELGRLALAINRMAKAVGDRDAALARQFAELEQARSTAESANEAKAEFLGTMSHELRTPLNGVLGMTELLARTPLNAKQREYTETIALAGRSLLGIIDDILDFTRLNAGKLRLEPRSVDLARVVGEAAGLVRQQATAKGLELRVEYARGLPLRVYADPARVRQVLVNLASNAIKFTERGQVTVHLRCERTVDGKAELHLAVEDTGMGIAPEDLPLLGERFTQLDSGFGRHHGGTGLGLSITKSLLALMDGELRITSTVGRGSTFTAVMRLRLST